MSWLPPGYQPNNGSGYKVTFDDFRNLVAYPPYRPSISALLRKLVRLRNRRDGSNAVVRSPAGDVIDLSALPAAIQSDPQKQYYLYQSAMTLWRYACPQTVG